MVTIRKAADRGHVEYDWLDTRHTFSFGHYHDPAHMGFGALRVINEDRVRPGAGFDTHGHRDMEILTWVLEGALEHRDSLGNGSLIRPGELQRMSAGTGVLHSEHNASRQHPVHLLQIWVRPARAGMAPGYEQKAFGEPELAGRLRLLAAPDGREGALTVHQDAAVYATRLRSGEAVTLTLGPGRRAWVQVARGTLHLNGETLHAGDGAAVTGETTLRLEATDDGPADAAAGNGSAPAAGTDGAVAEALLFDLA